MKKARKKEKRKKVKKMRNHMRRVNQVMLRSRKFNKKVKVKLDILFEKIRIIK